MLISFAKFTRQESADYTALMALTKIKRCEISVGQKKHNNIKKQKHICFLLYLFDTFYLLLFLKSWSWFCN